MEHRLVIAGAGNLGRELAGWIRDENASVEIAFIDDTLPSSVSTHHDLPFLGKIHQKNLLPQDQLLVAMSLPAHRARILAMLADQRIGTFIHNSTRVMSSAEIGAGSMIFPYAVVSVNAVLGLGAIVNVHSSVGHDVTLGDYCTLSSHVDLCGHVVVGKRVRFGSGCRVLPGLHIGDDAVIGAGAVVTRDVEEGETVFGVPARRVK